jgi:hypothetical protein
MHLNYCREDVQHITEEVLVQLDSESAVDKMSVELLKAVRESSRSSTPQDDFNPAAFSSILSKMMRQERELHFQSQLLK